MARRTKTYEGFRRRSEFLVDNEGEYPPEDHLRAARISIGCGIEPSRELREKWISVKDQKYEKEWMFLIGY